MKLKHIALFSFFVLLLLFTFLTTSFIDSARVRNGIEPKYTIKTVSEDGSKVTYWGLGYKVILYPSVSPNEPYKNHRAVKYGSWFMQYDPHDENAAAIDALKQKYPHFFDLPTEGTLTVYIWQMAENNYTCYLTTKSIDALSDMSFAFEGGASMEEMRLILSSYAIKKENISLQPVPNPLSSYYYEIDDAYRQKIELLFWKG